MNNDSNNLEREDLKVVREYVKETVEINGVTIIRKVLERECKICKWFPFGLWIGNWIWILGITALLIWFYWGE